MTAPDASTPNATPDPHFARLLTSLVQNAALFLGQIPHPETGQPHVDLDVARQFIDEIEALEHKTRGNLTQQESGFLHQAIQGLQLAYVELAAGSPMPPPAEPELARASPPPPATAPPSPEPSQGVPPPQDGSAPDPEESKRKFIKSYGP